MLRDIQTETHNSIEDSVAVMELVQHKINNPTAGENVHLTDSDNLFELLHAQSRRSVMIDQPRLVQSYATTIVDCVPVGILFFTFLSLLFHLYSYLSFIIIRFHITINWFIVVYRLYLFDGEYMRMESARIVQSKQ